MLKSRKRFISMLTLFILLLASCLPFQSPAQFSSPITSTAYTPTTSYAGYIMSYFTGDGWDATKQIGEKLALAYSYDGKYWTELKKNIPLSISGSNVWIRDPFILRLENGNFRLLATAASGDPANFWVGCCNDYYYAWDSTDLTSFTNGRKVTALTGKIASGKKGAGRSQNWAPEAIYDPVQKKYMVTVACPDVDGQIYKYYTDENFSQVLNKRDAVSTNLIEENDMTTQKINGKYLTVYKRDVFKDNDLYFNSATSLPLVGSSWSQGKNIFSPADVTAGKDGEGLLLGETLNNATKEIFMYADFFTLTPPKQGMWTTSFSAPGTFNRRFDTTNINPISNAYNIMTNCKHANIVPVTADELNQIINVYKGSKGVVDSFQTLNAWTNTGALTLQNDPNSGSIPDKRAYAEYTATSLPTLNYKTSKDFYVETSITRVATNNAGIVFCKQDDKNYYMAELRGDKIQLVRYVNGASKVIASGTTTMSYNKTYNIKIVRTGSNIKIFNDYVKLVDANDSTYGTSGYVGLRGLANTKYYAEYFSVHETL